MRQFFSDTKNDIYKNIKSLIFLEVLYKSIFLILMVPLFSWSIQKLLRLAGYSYLTIDNIAGFLKSPFTLLYGLILVIFLAFFITVEMVSLVIYSFSCSQNRKIRTSQILFPSIRKTFDIMMRKRQKMIPLFCLLEGIIIGLPLLFYSVENMRIPAYIAKSVFQYKSVIYIFILLVGTGAFVVFRGIFTLHFCVLEGKGLKEAYRESKKLEKGHVFQILRYFIAWNAILCFYFLLIYAIVILVTGICIYVTAEKTVLVVVFIRMLEQINSAVILLISILIFISNYALITKLFVTYKKENEALGLEIKKFQQEIHETYGKVIEINLGKKKRYLLNGIYFQIISLTTVIVVAFNMYYITTGFYESAFIETDSMFGTFVTAHRGASRNAPENTLEALEAAIDSFADYAEIDVQETKDGVVVLMHDSSLKRTCGVRKNIWDVTYEELLTYDAGSWFSSEFVGVRVPTLEEVLQLCNGRIKLNIELKITSHEQNLVEKVLALIEEYDFERQCVITSTNSSALAKVKELNEDIKTGYILSLAYGYFYDSEYADFFSVKSSFINETMVRVAHGLGKEVHAWTVNNRTEMERMRQLGVDNIITDEPLMTRELIYSDTTIATFWELIETIIK